MSQLAYTVNQAVAVPGLLGGIGPQEVRSYVMEGGASFGMGLILGTDKDKQAKVPAAAGGIVAGVAVLSHNDSESAQGLLAGDVASVVMQGAVWVKVEEAVGPASAVFLRHTAAGGNVPGNFRTDADTAKADQISAARWLTSTSGAGLALLALNLP